jgi:hypothetical protein
MVLSLRVIMYSALTILYAVLLYIPHHKHNQQAAAANAYMPHTAPATPHSHHQQQLMQQQPLVPLPLVPPLQQQQQQAGMMMFNSNHSGLNSAMGMAPSLPAVSTRNVHVLFEGPKAHEVCMLHMLILDCFVLTQAL